MKTPILRAAEHNQVMAQIKPCPKPENERAQRKAIELELDSISRKLVYWRDGKCVESGLGTCFGQLQWGHLFPQTECRYVRWKLGFAFVQCEGHNQLHVDRTQNHIYYGWYANYWGAQAWLRTNAYAHENKLQKLAVFELTELRDYLFDLWENRPAVYTPADLILRGYYGEIIRDWAK